MSGKRKISIRKVLQATVTLVVVVCCVLAISAASKMQDAKKLAGVDVRIENARYGFLDETEVKKALLHDRHIDISKLPVSKLDVRAMEKIIQANPWVSGAQVYVDNKKVMHVQVVQRVPAVRIFNKEGRSFYLDEGLEEVPLSQRYVHYATVVTNVPEYKNDSADKAVKAQILQLAKHIEQDTFWSAQVSHVSMTENGEFELIPVLGNHRIIVGDTQRLEEKFHNLMAFYRNILNKIGWDKYEVLDLRYKGQVVASPSIPVKLPANKKLVNMDWMKTVLDQKDPDLPVVNIAPVTASARPVTTPTVVENSEPVAEKPVVITTPEPVKVKAENLGAAVKQEPKQHTEKKERADKKKEEPKKIKEPNKPKEQEKPKYIYQGGDNN